MTSRGSLSPARARRRSGRMAVAARASAPGSDPRGATTMAKRTRSMHLERPPRRIGSTERGDDADTRRVVAMGTRRRERRAPDDWRRRRATSLCRFSPLKRRSLLFPRPASVTGREAGADEEGHRNAPRASADGSFHPDACAPDADPPRGSTRAPRLAHRRTSSNPRRTGPWDHPGTRSVGRDGRRRVDAGEIRARSRRPRSAPERDWRGRRADRTRHARGASTTRRRSVVSGFARVGPVQGARPAERRPRARSRRRRAARHRRRARR